MFKSSYHDNKNLDSDQLPMRKLVEEKVDSGSGSVFTKGRIMIVFEGWILFLDGVKTAFQRLTKDITKYKYLKRIDSYIERKN